MGGQTCKDKILGKPISIKQPSVGAPGLKLVRQ